MDCQCEERVALLEARAQATERMLQAIASTMENLLTVHTDLMDIAKGLTDRHLT